jgi:lysophospholipase L1-like esterase
MADPSELNIVALGDSITYDVNHATGWVAQLQAMFPGAQITNAGVPSDTLEQMAVRMQNYTPEPGKLNIMIIWGGTNDLASIGPGDTPDLLSSLVTQANNDGWQTWVVNTLPRWCFSLSEVAGFDASEQNVVTSLDAQSAVPENQYIDMYSHFLTSSGTVNTSLYNESPEYTHPNAQGDAVITGVMSGYIQQALSNNTLTAANVAFSNLTPGNMSGGVDSFGLSKGQSSLFATQS